MLSGIVIALALGPSGRGVVATVGVYDETATKLVALGVPAAVSYHGTADSSGVGDRRGDAELLGAALKISMLSIPAAALFGWIATSFVLTSLPDSIRLLLFVSMTSVPVVAVFPTACRALLVSRGSMRRLAVLGPLQTGTRLVGYLGLLFYDAFTPLSASVTFLLSNFVGHAVAVWLVRTIPRGGGSMRPLVAYGLRAVPSTLADLATSRLDQIILAGILTQAEFGLYAVAIGVNFLPVMLGLSLGSSSYRQVAEGGSEAARRTLERLGVVVLAAGVVTAFASLVLIVPVYGSEFDGSRLPALILSGGSVATGWYLGMAQIGNARNRPQIGSFAAMIGLVVTVIGLLIVLPAGGGIIGAAAVSSIAYAVRLVVCWVGLRRAEIVGTPG